MFIKYCLILQVSHMDNNYMKRKIFKQKFYEKVTQVQQKPHTNIYMALLSLKNDYKN